MRSGVDYYLYHGTTAAQAAHILENGFSGSPMEAGIIAGRPEARFAGYVLLSPTWAIQHAVWTAQAMGDDTDPGNRPALIKVAAQVDLVHPDLDYLHQAGHDDGYIDRANHSLTMPSLNQLGVITCEPAGCTPVAARQVPDAVLRSLKADGLLWLNDRIMLHDNQDDNQFGRYMIDTIYSIFHNDKWFSSYKPWIKMVQRAVFVDRARNTPIKMA